MLWLLRLLWDDWVWNGKSETLRLFFGKDITNCLAPGDGVCFTSFTVVNAHTSHDLGGEVYRLVHALHGGHINCALPSFVGCEGT